MAMSGRGFLLVGSIYTDYRWTVRQKSPRHRCLCNRMLAPNGLMAKYAAVLAVALLPQLVHSLKTRSTKGISYGWQLVYLFGLVLNFIYFLMIKATAAWATLTIEVFFCTWLLVLKIKIDGLECSSRSEANAKDISGDKDDAAACKSGHTDLESLDLELKSGLDNALNRAICVVDGNVDLTRNVDDLICKDAIRFRHDSTIGPYTLVNGAYRGFHIMIDAVFTIELPPEFGNDLLTQMCALAKIHGVRVVHDHAEIFDGTTPGFVAVALLDESHMSAHCYSGQGKLTFDVFTTCGANPDCTRKVARDVLFYLRRNLGGDAKYQIHHLVPLRPVHKGIGY
ncbi:PQ loop repeat domain containing protein [Nitzschia inconspicua]|uniref:PQ loop repeat domain containing protein n=1 Tax=Nitzschia inconspicua TaxID=303405 RepID=A0A9K3LJP0_9STRA|nr:PQ loop repeat domain containing protein [Nitzschia inconspicua]